ncbi:MAG: Lrp/AsnC family transcriptional regulator [Clostridia bacterium]|nr:Lrp/AsnC family transcriptional regulator [Clostridia bacterium]
MHKILDILQRDSRYTPKQIAVMLGKSEEEVKNAIENLEKNGTIVKYSAILDSEKLEGEHVEALIEVKVTPQKNRGFDSIAEELQEFKEVKSLYLMSGGFDLAVFVQGSSLKEVALFVSQKLSMVDNVISCATHFILKKYKIEGIITQQKENNNRMPYQP